MQSKTLALIEEARSVLSEYNPMTLRQVYYQLVSRQVLENSRSSYQRLSRALVEARQQGLIPWEWIEDRVRRPREVGMWPDVADFLETIRHSYRKDVWESQPRYVEVWLEKDALSGIFEDITRAFGVTLVVGRGYNSWSAYYGAACRFADREKPITILYFGDFDPSGEDMVRAMRDSLRFFETCPEIEKVALTRQDVADYNLPPDFTKKTDSRARAFIEKHGDLAVELDALSLPVLREKVGKAIAQNLDLDALAEARAEEALEREELGRLTL